MATNLDIYVNISATDNSRLTIPASFVLLDIANDKLIWSAGGIGVTDGDNTPTNTELDDAATIIQSSDVEIDKLFFRYGSRIERDFFSRESGYNKCNKFFF